MKVCYKCLKAIKAKEGVRTVDSLSVDEPKECEWCGEESEELYEI